MSHVDLGLAEARADSLRASTKWKPISVSPHSACWQLDDVVRTRTVHPRSLDDLEAFFFDGFPHTLPQWLPDTDRVHYQVVKEADPHVRQVDLRWMLGFPWTLRRLRVLLARRRQDANTCTMVGVGIPSRGAGVQAHMPLCSIKLEKMGTFRTRVDIVLELNPGGLGGTRLLKSWRASRATRFAVIMARLLEASHGVPDSRVEE